MKLTILKENLKIAFSGVERATGNGAMLPILKNILIKTEKGRIKIAATDLEIGITYYLNGKIVEEGGITVPSGVFGSILSNLNSSKLELEIDKNQLKIKTDNSQNSIQGLSETDFPIIPEIDSENNIEMKSADLKNALIQVIPAAAPADRRPELNGVLLWLNQGKLKLAATDGFRLAEKNIKADNFKTNIEEIRVIVPLKAAQELIKLCEVNNKVKIVINNHQIFFDFTDANLVSRLIEGNFPEYSERIPQANESEITLSKTELLDAVKLASVFVGKINDIKLRADKDVGLEISGNEATIGENKSEVKADISGEKQDLVLNWRYLIDGLKAIEGNDLFLGLNSEANPILMKSNKDNSYFYILMPIKSGY